MPTPSCCRSCSAMIKHNCKLQDVCAKVKRIKKRDAEINLDSYHFDFATRVIKKKRLRRR